MKLLVLFLLVASLSWSGTILSVPTITAESSGTGLVTQIDDLSEYLVVTGGTGADILDLTFFFPNGFGSENGLGADSFMMFTTNYGSLPNSDVVFSCIEGGEVCTWSETTPFTVEVPFIYGIPFLFTEDLTVFANSPPGEAASSEADVEVASWGVADDPSAQLESSSGSVPEVSPFGPTAFGLALLMGTHIRRRTAQERARRSEKHYSA